MIAATFSGRSYIVRERISAATISPFARRYYQCFRFFFHAVLPFHDRDIFAGSLHSSESIRLRIYDREWSRIRRWGGGGGHAPRFHGESDRPSPRRVRKTTSSERERFRAYGTEAVVRRERGTPIHTPDACAPPRSAGPGNSRETVRVGPRKIAFVHIHDVCKYVWPERNGFSLFAEI